MGKQLKNDDMEDNKDAAEDKVPIYTKLLYGVGEIGQYTTGLIEGLYINKFLLDVAKIPASAVGTLL